MKVIYKYRVFTQIPQELPKDAKILHIAYQKDITKGWGEQLMMWSLVDTDAEKEERIFEIYGTGQELPPGNRNYLTTVFRTGLVWHVFEKVTL